MLCHQLPESGIQSNQVLRRSPHPRGTSQLQKNNFQKQLVYVTGMVPYYSTYVQVFLLLLGGSSSSSSSSTVVHTTVKYGTGVYDG